MKKPEGYSNVMPYFILKDAENFMDFVIKCFGAEEKMKVQREDGSTIMHAELRLGDSVIMLAEATDEYSPMTSGVMIYVEDADRSYKTSLEMGAKSTLEPRDQDYGRSAGIVDKWGNTWWITSYKN